MGKGIQLAIERQAMGVIVVSGCPRSGTSLMMDLCRRILGDHRVVGDKFPAEKRGKRFARHSAETDPEWAVRQYIQGITGEKEQHQQALAETRDMNPGGFWECGWTVRGIQWSLREHAKIQNAMDQAKVVKVVSQGLNHTCPEYVGKVIHMVRHPRAVAKSQERLRGQFGGMRHPMKNGEEVRKHSPKMFVRVSKIACRWFEAAPQVPVLVVDFDDLIEDPQAQLARVVSFLGEGEAAEAVAAVDPKLRRSYPADVQNALWAAAESIFDHMKAEDWEAGAAVKLPKQTRQARPVLCTRLMRQVNPEECELCQTDLNTRRNFIMYASRAGINWEGEPCLRECLGGVTIDASVAANAWCSTDMGGAEIPRPVRQEWLCTNVKGVLDFVPCCGDKKRPGRVSCDLHGDQPAAVCWSCPDYKQSLDPVKRPR